MLDADFDPLGHFSDALEPTGKQVLLFVARHLKSTSKVFDWKSFKDDLDGYDENDMFFEC